MKRPTIQGIAGGTAQKNDQFTDLGSTPLTFASGVAKRDLRSSRSALCRSAGDNSEGDS